MVPEAAKARVEIDEFLDDNDMTNLFLLALSEMQKEDADKGKDSEDWWTFYSFSSTGSAIFFSVVLARFTKGIHGLPQELWNKVSNLNEHNNQDLISKGGGYCTHGSIVFSAWHRVYILMFEVAASLRLHCSVLIIYLVLASCCQQDARTRKSVRRQGRKPKIPNCCGAV